MHSNRAQKSLQPLFGSDFLIIFSPLSNFLMLIREGVESASIFFVKTSYELLEIFRETNPYSSPKNTQG